MKVMWRAQARSEYFVYNLFNFFSSRLAIHPHGSLSLSLSFPFSLPLSHWTFYFIFTTIFVCSSKQNYTHTHSFCFNPLSSPKSVVFFVSFIYLFCMLSSMSLRERTRKKRVSLMITHTWMAVFTFYNLYFIYIYISYIIRGIHFKTSQSI